MKMKRKQAVIMGILVLATYSGSVLAKAPDYIGSVQTVGEATQDETARGVVFIDSNKNSIFDEDEQGLAGVTVSNGLEVVVTDEKGQYEIPAYADMNLFITKPTGYTSPVDEDMVPQFYYIHKEAGSPPLRFGGIAPTGPLPEQINFPLIEDNVGESFQCMMFGDTQPYTNQEVSYVRDTVGQMLTNTDLSKTECLIFEGDVMGDDLALYSRFKKIIAKGRVPQYFVGGNHDVDFDADSDKDSFDTFRASWGPEYYSFNIGEVHFIVLDNVRYPCNGVDPHPFCSVNKKKTYNGVISERQLAWLKNELATVPKDKLIVVNAHIPFVTFTDAESQKHQTDNYHELVHILDGRKALGLSGHTHTIEQILPGEHYHGFSHNTGVSTGGFHQIVTGAVSGSWWAGDLNDSGIPHATQRLGSPRGYYVIDFSGNEYIDTYMTYGGTAKEQFHASFSTPRYRKWAEKLFNYVELYDNSGKAPMVVSRNDLGDMNMLTQKDLAETTWVVVNVWNGSKASSVSVSINGKAAIQAKRTQEGEGEKVKKGVEWSDPYALAKQSSQGRAVWKSTTGGDETAGFTTWRGVRWSSESVIPFAKWMLTNRSPHLWRAELPTNIPPGSHTMEIITTDRYNRNFTKTINFEVVEEIPPMGWNGGF